MLFLDKSGISDSRWHYVFNQNKMISGARQQMEDIVCNRIWCDFTENRDGIWASRAPFGIKIIPEKAKLIEPIIMTAEPWESSVSSYFTVIRDEDCDCFKMWYGVNIEDTEDYSCKSGRRLEIHDLCCYAESRDGLYWEKPRLDQVKYKGQPTNILGFDTPVSTGAPFIDTIHPETGKFKIHGYSFFMGDEYGQKTSNAVFGKTYLSTEITIYSSNDGLIWKKLCVNHLRGCYDTYNVITCDHFKDGDRYSAYMRGKLDDRAGGRTITRSEFDLLDEIPVPELLMYPDNEDDFDVDYYTNCFTFLPSDNGIRLLFPSIFHHRTDTTDIRMAVSRDGKNYSWVSRIPVIGNERYSVICANPNLLSLGNTLALPLSGTTLRHNEYFTVSSYGRLNEYKTDLMYAVWEKDRLCGIEAEESGEFYINVKKMHGSNLQLNLKTFGQGRVLIELQKEDDTPYDGFALDDSYGLRGDLGWTDFLWSGAGDISSLEGKDVTIRFRLDNAKIFGYRIV